MLLAFTPEQPRRRLEDLAREVGVPASTAYRHLALLREMGLVEDDGNSTYRLAPLILRLAGAMRAGNLLLDIARPVIESLRNQSGETVLLYKHVGDYAACIEILESEDPIRLSSSLGSNVPLGQGAGAKVLLAYLSDEERNSYRSRKVDARKIDDAELKQIRSKGWAVSSAEVSPGVWAVAAPVRDADGVIHSLIIAGPAFRLDETRQRQLIDLVVTGANCISQSVGRNTDDSH